MPVATWRCQQGESSLQEEAQLGEKGRDRRQISDRQWHKTVVLLDVSLEDIWARAKNTFKPRSVQLHTLQGPAGDHGGSARTIHEKCDFTWGREKGQGHQELVGGHRGHSWGHRDQDLGTQRPQLREGHEARRIPTRCISGNTGHTTPAVNTKPTNP